MWICVPLKRTHISIQFERRIKRIHQSVGEHFLYFISSVLSEATTPLHSHSIRARSLSLCSRIVHLQIVYYSIYKLELCERCDTTRMCNASKSNMNRNCCCLLFSLSLSRCVSGSVSLYMFIPYRTAIFKHVRQTHTRERTPFHSLSFSLARCFLLWFSVIFRYVTF